MDRFGLLGRSLAHSLSPQIHAFFGDYPYDIIEKEPEQLKPFFENCPYRAINVTIPYKKDVMPFCDEIDESARRIGSVNTICFDNDAVRGYNTDYAGFSYLLQHNRIAVNGKKAVVLGSGGSSVTVCCVLRDLGAREVVVISRTGENNYQNLSRHADAGLIVNTTPVGMYPHNLQSPVDLQLFSQCEAVVDIIYNPLKTALLLQAEQRGIKAVNGLDMLVAQGRCAAELFHRKPYADTVVQSTVSAIERDFRNVVLVGMPGCGKSTLMPLLAEALGKRGVDTDTLVEQSAGCTIPELFQAQGETAFRDLESHVIAESGKQNGQVIATGGGAVLRGENCLALRQNGLVVFLNRPLGKLSTAGRPLSHSDEAVKKLYAQRLPLYESVADIKVEVADDVQQTLQAVLTALNAFVKKEGEHL